MLISLQPILSSRNALKILLSLCAFALFGLVAACGGEEGSSIPDDIAAIDEPTIESFTGITGVGSDVIETINGYSASTEEITLKEGMLVMSAESDGGFFAVNIVQDGDNEVMFNETIKYAGTNAIKINDYGPDGPGLGPGPATMEIISSEDWSISYTQQLETGVSPIMEISGYQDFVLPSVDFKAGKYTLTADTDSEFGHFAVKLIPHSGAGSFLLLNGSNPDGKSDEFEINTSDKYSKTEGLYTMIVTSSSNWEISIK